MPPRDRAPSGIDLGSDNKFECFSMLLFLGLEEHAWLGVAGERESMSSVDLISYVVKWAFSSHELGVDRRGEPSQR